MTKPSAHQPDQANTNHDTHDQHDDNQDVLQAFFGASTPTLSAHFKAGFVSIVGRPNVGKSTLMNHLLGQKLSITSRKPQTTRHKITGIVNSETSQIVFVDTPGMHKREVKQINKFMNKAAFSALNDVSAVLFLVDLNKWTPDDDLVLDKIKRCDAPVILVINKVDRLEDKHSLLPYLEQMHQRFTFAEIIPVSALHGHNLDRLKETIEKYLPLGTPLYPLDQMTDRSERFLASEIIREKIMRSTGDELPYDLTVQIESFKEEAEHTDPATGKHRKACTFVDASIFVERPGQKAIIIGDKGQKIKTIGMDARQDMEKMFGTKIMLTLWVKVKEGWSDDERALKSLGYSDI